MDSNNNKKKRFVTFSKAGYEDLLKKKTSKNTDSSTKTAVTLFKTFCEETDNVFHEQDSSPLELDNLLVMFYAGARTAKGEMYKVNSLKSMRFSLQRYFIESRGINIIEDDEFVKSNCCFQNVLNELQKSGKGSTEHYPEIEPEDLQKLNASFDINTPVGLLEKVWFDIVFYLIRRGRENLRQMTRKTFVVGMDGTGKQFIHQPLSEVDKNHHVSDHSFDTIGEGRIYETGRPKCPVKMFLKYVSLLNPLESALWQRPKQSVEANEKIWYCNAPLGEKSLGNMMPNMSVKYGLSQRYTNHSIRVTSLQILDDDHVEGRHIIRVSGHKSVDSVKNYARRLSSSRKRGISSVLSSHLNDNANNIQQNEIHQTQNVIEISDVDKKKSQTQQNIDFNIVNDSGDIDDDSLVSLPNNLFGSGNVSSLPGFFKPSFSMCDNCNFTFNINFK